MIFPAIASKVKILRVEMPQIQEHVPLAAMDMESASMLGAAATGGFMASLVDTKSVRDLAVGTVSVVLESADVIRDGVHLIAQPEPVCLHAQEAVKMESASAQRVMQGRIARR